MSHNAPHTSTLDFRLADFTDRDWFIQLYTNQEIMRSIPGGVMTKERATETANRVVSRALSDGLGYYVVRFKSEHEQVGYVVLRPFGWDERFQGTELGYIIDRQFWGKRIASKVAAAVVEYATGVLKKDRLLAFVGNENTASIKVVSQLGFRRLPEVPVLHPGYSTWELTAK